ncbi:hypothetical protein ABZV14_40195 [Streptosporangium canum]
MRAVWREDLVAFLPGCGLTFAIGHLTGHMAITDARDDRFQLP